MSKGRLFIVSAPSGCGKGTILAEVFKGRKVYYSVSCTTRKPREGEVDGVNYFFLSEEQFSQMIAEDGFLEYAQYVGNFYGSPKKQAEEWMHQGKDVILEIEVQGCKKIKEKFPQCVSIFIMPPSMEILESRLRGRGTETEDVIAKRMKRAEEEIGLSGDYDHVVINDTVEECVEGVRRILELEKQKASEAES